MCDKHSEVWEQEKGRQPSHCQHAVPKSPDAQPSVSRIQIGTLHMLLTLENLPAPSDAPASATVPPPRHAVDRAAAQAPCTPEAPPTADRVSPNGAQQPSSASSASPVEPPGFAPSSSPPDVLPPHLRAAEGAPTFDLSPAATGQAVGTADSHTPLQITDGGAAGEAHSGWDAAGWRREQEALFEADMDLQAQQRLSVLGTEWGSQNARRVQELTDALAALRDTETALGKVRVAPPLLWRCPSTANVWQTLNTGKSPRVPKNLIISGAVHGQISEHCLGAVCQTIPVLRYRG